ncbi:nuclear RNA export factor 2-like [Acomys russatus]|uniref:nuclear RNA export factor 2-like n=1 Tax=Acomys russatus TaxID=60746 RepID=UPI0021E2B2FC|nr:nuclear RNA export factor 2-like [Acomys russatus]
MCSIERKQRTFRHAGGRRDRGSSLDYTGKRTGYYEHPRSMLRPSKACGDGRNVRMRGALWNSSVRYTPYAERPKSRVEKRMEDQIHITVWRDDKHRKRKMGQVTEDGILGPWFKVTIPCGRKSDKTQLMRSLHSLCSVPFTAVDFQCDQHRIQFFVQYVSTATALKNVSYKMCDENYQKIPIFVNPSDVPYSVQNRFTGEQMEQLKLVMWKRYDVSQHALYLQKLRFDPDLMKHDIDMILSRRSCMAATLQIIREDFPELLSLNLSSNKLFQLDSLFEVVEKAPQLKILNLSKNMIRTMCELEKVKGLKLEELWLEGNPLCNTFPDHSAYVSAVRDCFPELSYLDGRKLPHSTVIDNEEDWLTKPCKGSFNDPEAIKDQVQQFLQEYYLMYDYGERQGLLNTYHDQACFSLTIPFNPGDPDLSSMCRYFKDERDRKNPKEFCIQRQLLKYTKQDIVDYLKALPKTLHAFSSFHVDICFQMETMICFSVKGMFKEVDGSSEGCIRAFMRIFVATFGRSSNLCIVNDQLFVMNPRPGDIQDTLAIPMPTSCPSFKLVLSQEEKRMVQVFSTQSGLKLEWSQKCLEDNKWDYTQATKVFAMLQTKNKIPMEFFKGMT